MVMQVRPSSFNRFIALAAADMVEDAAVVRFLSPPGKYPRLNTIASAFPVMYEAMRSWESQIRRIVPSSSFFPKPSQMRRLLVADIAFGWISKAYSLDGKALASRKVSCPLPHVASMRTAPGGMYQEAMYMANSVVVWMRFGIFCSFLTWRFVSNDLFFFPIMVTCANFVNKFSRIWQVVFSLAFTFSYKKGIIICTMCL